MPSAEEFKRMMANILKKALEEGRDHIDINSGDLHRRVGGYPGPNHRMVVCCQVMYDTRRIGDEILSAPPKGRGASLTIRYRLPRNEGKPSAVPNQAPGPFIGQPSRVVKPPPTSSPRLDWRDIHRALEELPKHSGYSHNLPDNGIYFFYEKGETCCFDGVPHDRIVRVGTHREENRFKDRILNHYGNNKNASVFRKHVGTALIQRDKLDFDVKLWHTQDGPTDENVESRVSNFIRENFYFRCIPVEGKDRRLDLEEKFIATLCTKDLQPSDNWLGRFAYSKKVREAGIWNSQHVGSNKILLANDVQCLLEIAPRGALSNGTPAGRILLATACGANKHPGAHRAVELYQSARIKAIYNRRGDCDMAILSAKYGLVDSETVIESYDQIMDQERARALLQQVREYVRRYDAVIFFKGGSRSEYHNLISTACRMENIPCILFGFMYMGEIGRTEDIIREAMARAAQR